MEASLGSFEGLPIWWRSAAWGALAGSGLFVGRRRYTIGHRDSEDQSLRYRIDDRSNRYSLAASWPVTLVLLGRALPPPFSILCACASEPRVDQRKQEGAAQKGDCRACGSGMPLSRNGEMARDSAQERARAERHHARDAPMTRPCNDGDQQPLPY